MKNWQGERHAKGGGSDLNLGRPLVAILACGRLLIALSSSFWPMIHLLSEGISWCHSCYYNSLVTAMCDSHAELMMTGADGGGWSKRRTEWSKNNLKKLFPARKTEKHTFSKDFPRTLERSQLYMKCLKLCFVCVVVDIWAYTLFGNDTLCLFSGLFTSIFLNVTRKSPLFKDMISPTVWKALVISLLIYITTFTIKPWFEIQYSWHNYSGEQKHRVLLRNALEQKCKLAQSIQQHESSLQ